MSLHDLTGIAANRRKFTRMLASTRKSELACLSSKSRTAAVEGPERRLRVGAARPRRAAPVEGRLDGDGGVTRAVESQRLSVTRLSRVTGDDPGQEQREVEEAVAEVQSVASKYPPMRHQPTMRARAGAQLPAAAAAVWTRAVEK
ncbi:hypothetical protein EYF80_041484 [Liparis tanakae]|uniref:Uncharacterized protein n=1 Tax=Liparis tanakae TaxID=230148 RepID=A0A4Z2G6Y9_9TELE|nr:hypothetical protein EYF80_041484 [Liparis tanakae]